MRTDDFPFLAGGRSRCVTIIGQGCDVRRLLPAQPNPTCHPVCDRSMTASLQRGPSLCRGPSLWRPPPQFGELNTEKRIILRRNLSLVQGLESFCVRSRSFFGHPLYYFSRVFSDFTPGGMAGISWHIWEVRKSVVSLGTALGMEEWWLSACSSLPLPPEPLRGLARLCPSCYFSSAVGQGPFLECVLIVDQNVLRA